MQTTVQKAWIGLGWMLALASCSTGMPTSDTSNRLSDILSQAPQRNTVARPQSFSS